MKIPTKCRYGIRALIVIAKNHNESLTKRKQISSIQGIPNSYLENILIALKNGNLIKSIRGAGGGFMLKRPPEEITLLDVYEAIQGHLALLDCAECPSACERSEDCVVRPVWMEIQEAQKKVLEKNTIKHLLDQELKSKSLFNAENQHTAFS
jgi:Rrf2 family protein